MRSGLGARQVQHTPIIWRDKTETSQPIITDIKL